MPRPAATKGKVTVRKKRAVTYVAVPKARLKTVTRAATKAPRSTTAKAFRRGGASLGAMLGTALAGPAGGAAGGMLGRAGGAMISKLFGHGDYAVSNADSLKSNNLVLSNAAQMPQFGTGKVACKFVHREFLGDVYSSSTPGAFKIDSYPVNPGLGTTFPWLSGVVGAKFQQYRINGMAFEFRSMSSDALNSTNTALGSVIMSTDYDSADATFTSKQEMENTEYGISCKPSANMIHGIECERFQTPVSELYIRAFDVPSGKDIRLYDLARFSIASTGCQGANVNLGELWVSYDIDCFKAIEQVPGYLIPFSQYALQSAGATAPLGVTRTQLLTTGASNSINMTFTENRGFWPADIEVGSIYHVQASYLASSAVSATVPVIRSGNGMWMNNNTVWKTPNSTTTSMLQFNIDVMYKGGATPAALPYFEIGDFTWAVTMLQADLYVTQQSGLFPGVYTSQLESPHPDDEKKSEDDSESEDTAAPEYISVAEPSIKGLAKLKISKH